MMYHVLFLIRYFPFWAIPFALLTFEVGQYFYYRRRRVGYVLFFGMTGFFVIASLMWLIFEGYWRGPRFVKERWENTARLFQ